MLKLLVPLLCATLSLSSTDPALFLDVPLLVWKPAGSLASLVQPAECGDGGGVTDSLLSSIGKERTIVQIVRDSLSLEDFRTGFPSLQRAFESSASRVYVPRARPLEPALFPDRQSHDQLTADSIGGKKQSLITLDLGKGGDEELAQMLADVARKAGGKGDYVVVFTGRRASVPTAFNIHSRHRRSASHGGAAHSQKKAAPEAPTTIPVASSPCLRISASDARFHLLQVAGKAVDKFSVEIPLDAQLESVCVPNPGNRTQHRLTWGSGLPRGLKSVSINFDVESINGGKVWRVRDMKLTYAGTFAIDPANAPVKILTQDNLLNADFIKAASGTPYVGKGTTQFRPAERDTNRDYQAKVTFDNLMFQGSAKAAESGEPLMFGAVRVEGGQEYWSIEVLTALFILFFFSLIMAWAFSMMAKMRTNDQFDDPKGKTITVPLTAE